MTPIMVIVGSSVRTPILLWLVAMCCDTVLLSIYMLTHWQS